MANAAMIDKAPIEADDFESIVNHHQRQIYRVLLFLVRDPDAAGTLTQECFLRAFKSRKSFRNESNLSTWLIRIAINLAHDHNKSRRWAFWRRLKRMDRLDATKATETRRSPEQILIRSELVASIQSALDTLPERQRTVFVMRFIDDMAIETIAEALGLEPGTVKTHLHRAMDAVRKVCRRQAFQG